MACSTYSRAVNYANYLQQSKKIKQFVSDPKISKMPIAFFKCTHAVCVKTYVTSYKILFPESTQIKAILISSRHAVNSILPS